MTRVLDYFYGTETHRFRFYRIPKALFDEDISLEAATLYGLMLDRVGLSARNGWTDAQGRVYIYFTQKDVQARLRCGHNRATAFMRELERFGLIERKRQGLGKPAKIFVKNYVSRENDAVENTDGAAQNGPLFSAPEEAVQTAQKGQSRVPETGSPDCPVQAANDTEKRETELSETNRIHPQPPHAFRKRFCSQEKLMDRIRWMREELRENIDYDFLIADKPEDQSLIDGYIELMTEACSPAKETVRICGQELPAAMVRSRFLKLERAHIEYVRDCMGSTSSEIRNIKAYTLAALYNAPATMEQYYTALVTRDMLC